jgi:hypothetical protein
VPPSGAKRMSGRVGVGLVAQLGIEVGRGPEKSGTESHRLLVGNSGIVDVEIEVDLLRAAVRPLPEECGWARVVPRSAIGQRRR